MLQVPLGKSKIRFMLGLWGTSDLKRVMVSLEQHKPNTILGYVREAMDLGGLPKAIRKTGRLRRPAKQLNTVTRRCGENSAALSGQFQD
jgi:hypothetical protein